MTQALRSAEEQAPDAEYSGASFEAFDITSLVTSLHAAYRVFVVAVSTLGRAERCFLENKSGISPRDAQRGVALKRRGSGGFFTASTISIRRETSTTSKTEQTRCQRLLMKASRTTLQATCRIKKRDLS